MDFGEVNLQIPTLEEKTSLWNVRVEVVASSATLYITSGRGTDILKGDPDGAKRCSTLNAT
jgi:hypothetical protein